jgi:acyl dehydratase
MAIDRRHVGVVSEPRVIDVEKGQLKFFAKATGETNPVYFDEDAARAAGHPDIPAPPTFTFSLQLGAPAARGDLFADVGVDMRNVLHGEQSFRHRHMIYAGDRISLTTTTTDIYEKKGGALEFIVQDTAAVNQDGRLCVEMRVVTVVRNPARKAAA